MDTEQDDLPYQTGATVMVYYAQRWIPASVDRILDMSGPGHDYTVTSLENNDMVSIGEEICGGFWDTDRHERNRPENSIPSNIKRAVAQVVRHQSTSGGWDMDSIVLSQSLYPEEAVGSAQLHPEHGEDIVKIMDVLLKAGSVTLEGGMVEYRMHYRPVPVPRQL